MADTRTWSLLSLSDGDHDDFGVRYSFNERVHNSKKVGTDHFELISNGEAFLLWEPSTG